MVVLFIYAVDVCPTLNHIHLYQNSESEKIEALQPETSERKQKALNVFRRYSGV